MIRYSPKQFGICLLLVTALSNIGCVTPMMGWGGGCGGAGCDTCSTGSCGGCGTGCGGGWFSRRCGGCGGCGMMGCGWLGGLRGRFAHRSLAIPDEYPVGSVMRAHFHQMQTNAEAADFILYQKDFVGQTAELTPDGKDKILEIAARMRSVPFPVIVERDWNNADPELDSFRRDFVAMVLADKGNPDANNRVFVSPSYGPGKQSLEAAPEYYMFTYQGLGGNGNGFGGGGGGGFGGGGGGGFGGGGGGFGGGGGGFGGFGQ
ncbi:MAG: hypothetical protein JSS49_10945 [Planctomycetes bacterium]|nr:hypothetical protein [Planctomycetota bacterium]